MGDTCLHRLSSANVSSGTLTEAGNAARQHSYYCLQYRGALSSYPWRLAGEVRAVSTATDKVDSWGRVSNAEAGTHQDCEGCGR